MKETRIFECRNCGGEILKDFYGHWVHKAMASKRCPAKNKIDMGTYIRHVYTTIAAPVDTGGNQ